MQLALGARYDHGFCLKPGQNLFWSGSYVTKKEPAIPRSASIEDVVELVWSLIHWPYSDALVCNPEAPYMGADPEFFLRRLDHPDVIPAFKVLPARPGKGLFWDGFQGEATVFPSKCIHILALNVRHSISALARKGLAIVPQNVWRVPDVELQSAEEIHVALGCKPSLNVYGMRGRAVPDSRALKWRFAGGHMHFEYPKRLKTRENIDSIIKALDAILAVPCVAIAAKYDSPIRRKFYGLAGEFRLPAHGIEYRTLSNFWMIDPRVFHLVFDLGRFAFMLGRLHWKKLFIGDPIDVVSIINYHDVRAARELTKLNRPLYDAFLRRTYGHTQPFWDAVNHGIEAVIPKFGQDVAARWLRSPEETTWRCQN